MNRNPARPLSPHLTIWRWGPHMLISILHRATGVALATAGALGFVWWLVALATGPEAYAIFLDVAESWFGILVAFGLTLAFFIHLGNGIRHLFLDIGANYELRGNKRGAVVAMAFGVVATLAMWTYIFVGKA